MAGNASSAIITSAGNQKTYRVGDRLEGGFVLEKIAGDGVTLVAGETRLRLPLKRNTASIGAASEPAQSRAAQKPSAEPVKDSGSGLAYWRLRNSSPGLPLQGLLTPDPSGGFRLEGVKPRSPYSRMGLQAGDVLRSVNSAPFVSDEQLMALYNQARLGVPGELGVFRDGRFEVLRFPPG